MRIAKPFLALLVMVLSANTFAQDRTSTEILTVEVLGTFDWKTPKSKGVYIHWPNAEVELVPFENCGSFGDCMTSRGMVVRNKLQELHDQGWELIAASGGDTYTRYVLKKN